MDGVAPRDGPLVAAEADRQVPAAAAPDGHALQDRLLVPRFLEDCKALIFRKEGAGPFR